MTDTLRTFVAVETSQPVRRRAEELMQLLSAAGVDVRWVDSHNLHLTLKFLDEVPTREIPGVCEAVQRAAAGVPAFDLTLCGAGAFPHPGRPRTLWLGGGEGSQRLAVLHAALEKALAPLGFRKEPRAFEPHLTIGRGRGGGPALGELARLLKEHAAFDAGRFRVAELVVFSSQLMPRGPIYEALARAPLVPRPA
jgi:2'-5' RNA ligase